MTPGNDCQPLSYHTPTRVHYRAAPWLVLGAVIAILASSFFVFMEYAATGPFIGPASGYSLARFVIAPCAIVIAWIACMIAIYRLARTRQRAFFLLIPFLALAMFSSYLVSAAYCQFQEDQAIHEGYMQLARQAPPARPRTP